MIWIDAQLSPYLASWIRDIFGTEAKAVREIGLHNASDRDVYKAARTENAVLMTKDSDFLILLDELGPPPQVLWITCGNTSNAYLKRILEKTLPNALDLLRQGEAVVEIRD